MDIENINLQDYDFLGYNGQKIDKEWYKIVNGKRGNRRDLMNIVLNDAINGKKVATKGGSYYSCARFIKRYHKSFTFKKTSLIRYTCCHSYPKICGGVCCCSNIETRCNCDSLPSKSIHINNCYEDNCNIVKIPGGRRFNLQWLPK
jgi:hypothetical protein